MTVEQGPVYSQRVRILFDESILHYLQQLLSGLYVGALTLGGKKRLQLLLFVTIGGGGYLGMSIGHSDKAFHLVWMIKAPPGPTILALAAMHRIHCSDSTFSKKVSLQIQHEHPTSLHSLYVLSLDWTGQTLLGMHCYLYVHTVMGNMVS